MSDEFDNTQDNIENPVQQNEITDANKETESVVEEFSVPEPVIAVAQDDKTNDFSASRKTKKFAGTSWFKKNSGLCVFIVILLIALSCGIYSVANGKKSYDNKILKESRNIVKIFNKNEDITEIGTFKKEYIAVLKIEGTIEKMNQTYDQDWLLSSITDLQDDNLNKGLMLFINSPGGTVYEADEMYLALLDYKKNTGRPVWAYFGSMAASGGYYIGCAADHISANRNTLTGSIGVLYGPAVDLTELFDKHGIKMTTFKAGKNKNMLNYNSPVTEEHAAIMQSIVDEAYDQFTGIVAESRKIPLYEVRQIADGRVYTANQALYNHLIDDICSYDSALDDMKSTCFPDLKSSDIDVNVIEKQRKKTFLDILKDAEMSFKASPNPVEAVIAERFDAMPSGLLYYCQF